MDGKIGKRLLASKLQGLSRAIVAGAASVALVCSLMPAAAFAASGGQGGQASSASYVTSKGAQIAEDEIIVEYDDSSSTGSMSTFSTSSTESTLARELDAESIETIAEPSAQSGSIVSVQLPEGLDVDSAVEQAASVPGVKFAQPNFKYSLLETSSSDDTVYNDPYISSQQYYLKGGWEDSSSTVRGADVISAWKQLKAEGIDTSAKGTIAVLDTGARVTHEDLAGNIDTAHMRDMYNKTEPGTLISANVPNGDNCGHGTHCCGIAAGVAGNAKGIAGASGNAKVLPIKVFDDSSSNPGCETETLIEAYQYLLGLVESGELGNLHVISMSLGGYAWEGENDEMLEKQISLAREQKILTVAAGGNGDSDNNPITDPSYPSDFSNVMAVTALTKKGTNAKWSDYNEDKDISAPGVSIYSSYKSDDSSYTNMSGTSMATPLVAGIASLLWSANGALTVGEVEDTIYQTANALDPDDEYYRGDGDVAGGSATGSHGAIDAGAAVAWVIAHYGVDGKTYKDFTACSVDALGDAVYDDGNAVVPSQVTVHAADGTLLQEGVDYIVSCTSNTAVGTATANVWGQGEYRGKISATYKIKYDLERSSKLIQSYLTRSSYPWTGRAVEPGVTVFFQDGNSKKMLKKGSDYTLSYSKNVDAGTAYVTVTGMGDTYTGSVVLPFTILPKNISECSIAPIEEQTCTGTEPKPKLDITNDGTALVENTDYTVVYSSDLNAGTGKAVVMGIGNYTGSTSIGFSIAVKDAQVLKLASIADQVYTGKQVKPALKVTLRGKVLKAGTDYSVSYSANKKVGVATAKVILKNGRTGSISGSFKILPKGSKVKSVKRAGGKALKISYVKQAQQTSGYQVRCAAAKSMKGAKTVKVAKVKKTTVKIGKLKRGKKYYVQVRTYKKVGSKVYWSSWSKSKRSVKVA